MTESIKEPDLQTMTVVGKVSVTDESTALLLGLLDYSATKRWNTAVWHAKEVRKKTGKIPSYAKMDVTIKQEHPLWYRRLHSQSSQAVLQELWQSYKSWFALRKKGDENAKPPGFRRKNSLSAVTFGAVINADVNSAINIHKRYLPEQISVSWSSGCLAQPAVNRFAWRETRPLVSAHKPGTWQTSLPHLRTESARLLAVREPDSGILGLQAGEDVNPRPCLFA